MWHISVSTKPLRPLHSSVHGTVARAQDKAWYGSLSQHNCSLLGHAIIEHPMCRLPCNTVGKHAALADKPRKTQCMQASMAHQWWGVVHGAAAPGSEMRVHRHPSDAAG